MTRPALLIAILLSAVPMKARAQGTGAEPGYALVLFTPLAPAVAFDLLLISNLVTRGTVRKGFGINAIIFGGISMMIGAALAVTLLPDTRVKTGWGLLAISVAELGAGTAVLGLYGLTHLDPQARPVEDDELKYRPPRDPEDAPAPPVPPPPAQVRLFPQLSITPRGEVLLGITGTL